MGSSNVVMGPETASAQYSNQSAKLSPNCRISGWLRIACLNRETYLYQTVSHESKRVAGNTVNTLKIHNRKGFEHDDAVQVTKTGWW